MSRMFSALWLSFALSLACSSCRQQPPPPTPIFTDGGTPVVITGQWTERAHQILSYLGDADTRPGGISIAITVVELWPISDLQAKAQVLTSLREVKNSTLPELQAAVTAFERGDQGGRCRASAAVRSIGITLRAVATSLARIMHWDVADQLRFAISLAVSLADELNPSCAPDAGLQTLSNETHALMAARGDALRAFPTVQEAQAAHDRGAR